MERVKKRRTQGDKYLCIAIPRQRGQERVGGDCIRDKLPVGRQIRLHTRSTQSERGQPGSNDVAGGQAGTSFLLQRDFEIHPSMKRSRTGFSPFTFRREACQS